MSIVSLIMPVFGGGRGWFTSRGFELEWAEEDMLLSLAVIQWRTRTEKRTWCDKVSRDGASQGRRKHTFRVAAHQTYPCRLTVKEHDSGKIPR
jgi:hypothetical protein